MLADFVWNLDPVLLRLGPLAIRYYGMVFALTLLTGYVFWRWQMRRGGYSQDDVDGFILWSVVAVIGGARLGHCFFYHPVRYLSDPITILQFWRGGLASHGATVGLIVALVLYARRRRLRVVEVLDRFAMSAAVGSAGIRLGNFLNSEIVGRPTTVPWAVRFVRFEAHAVPRHPSQLYELALGLTVLGTLVLVDRLAGREKRPLGLMVGLFLTLYFAGRFCVEFVKEYHTLSHSVLTMGQYLSILPFLAGAGLLVWTSKRRLVTADLPPLPKRQALTEPEPAPPPSKRRRRRRKR